MTDLASAPARVSVAGFEPGAAGVTPPANPERRGAFLADVVVELGFADPDAVEEAMQTARRSLQTVERSLLDSGVLDEERLALAIAERNGLDHVDLDRFEVDMEAAEMVGRATALRYRAVPIAFAADGALIVAVEDPCDSLGISDIEAMTRSEVRPAIATGRGIQSVIERLPEEPAAQPAAPPAPVAEPPAAQAATPTPQPLPEPAPPAPSEGGAAHSPSEDVEALREAVRRADALAVAVGQRIGELEGADERAQRLEGELAAAGERAAALEQRLTRVVGAAGEAVTAIEKLSALHRALEEPSL